MTFQDVCETAASTAPSDGSRGTGATGRDGAGSGVCDLIIGQLLCARVCHDLIGPTAAINAGEELIRDGDDSEEARDLIAESARQLSGRLSFFRALFSQGAAAGAGYGLAEARTLTEGFLLGSRVCLDWPAQAGDGALPAEGIRPLMGMIMLAADTLSRGGTVRIRLHREHGEARVELQATGARVHLAPELLQALHSEDAGSLSARTVHAFHLGRLVRLNHAELSIDATEGQSLQMRLRLSAPDLRAAA